MVSLFIAINRPKLMDNKSLLYLWFLFFSSLAPVVMVSLMD